MTKEYADLGRLTEAEGTGSQGAVVSNRGNIKMQIRIRFYLCKGYTQGGTFPSETKGSGT